MKRVLVIGSSGAGKSTFSRRLHKATGLKLIHLCTWRVFKRVLIYRKGGRPDMAEGCDERFDWEFIKWTWNYPTRSKPGVEELLKRFENEKTIIRLKSQEEIENFLVSCSQTHMMKSG